MLNKYTFRFIQCITGVNCSHGFDVTNVCPSVCNPDGISLIQCTTYYITIRLW